MSSAGTPRPARIGQLAAELGLNPRTIRYYEQLGLLPPARRTPAGYRLYDAADRDRLRFILKARRIGLALGEIADILALRGQGQQPCQHVLGLVDRKLEAVERQLRALAEFRQELLSLRAEAAETMATEACVCGIIEQHQPTRQHEVELEVLAPVARAPRQPSEPRP